MMFGFGFPLAGGGPTLSGPQIAPANAAAVFSLRRMTPRYFGAALRVRRDSDNAETDLGFNGSGDFNAAALLAFAGSASAYVTTWYEQQRGLHATQSTAANQPRIVNAGVLETFGGKPTVRGMGGQFLRLPNGTLGTAPDYLINLVGKAISTGSNASLIGSGGFGTNYAVNALRIASGAGFVNYWWGADLNGTSSVSIANGFVVSATWAGAGKPRTIYSNNTVANSDTPSVTPSNPGTNGTIFAANGSGFLDGVISEVVLAPFQTDASTRQTLERNQGAYYGVTVA